MVTPIRAPVLPQQPAREQQELARSAEATQRQDRARPRVVELTFTQPADAAAATLQTGVLWMCAPGESARIVRAMVACATAETADGTDYARVRLIRRQRGLSKHLEICEVTTEQLGFEQYIARDFTIPAHRIGPGESLIYISSKVGLGVQLGQLQLRITLEVSRA